MNKKGFTLVELLATIVILGVIAAIAMVSIDKMLDHSQETECENILLSIKSATKEFISTNRFVLDSSSNLKKDNSTTPPNITFELTVNELITDTNSSDKINAGGYLSNNITSPFNKKTLTTNQLSNMKVLVMLNNDYTYRDAIIKNASGSLITCSEDVKTGYERFPG